MQIPIENKGDSPLFVGGQMIPPGEIRTFNEEDLPAEHRPGAANEAIDEEANPLLAILALSIAKAALGLVDLDDDELAQLEALELEGQNRKGMLAEITFEKLRRAEIIAAGTPPAAPAAPEAPAATETAPEGQTTAAGTGDEASGD